MRLNLSTRTAVLLGVVAASGLVAAITAIAQDTRSLPNPDQNPRRAEAAQVQGVTGEQRAAFGILRRARGAGDDVPDFVTRAINGADREAHGQNPALARRVAIPGKRIWISVGAGSVCKMEQSAADDATGGCATIQDATEGRLVGWQDGGPVPAGQAIVSGVVPDGVSSVAVTYPDGRRDAVKVIDNVYAFTATGSPTIAFTDPGGTERTVGPLPVLPAGPK